MRLINIIVFALIIVFVSCGGNEGSKTTKKSEHRCANCGMITSKYPKWEQKIISQDKDVMYFDGARCMFKIILDSKEAPKKIVSIQVKDYYSLKYIDGKEAYYVTGSNVLGPMGNELIPFKSLKDAEEFKKDHNGKNIIRYADVDIKLIMKLAGKMKMKM